MFTPDLIHCSVLSKWIHTHLVLDQFKWNMSQIFDFVLLVYIYFVDIDIMLVKWFENEELDQLTVKQIAIFITYCIEWFLYHIDANIMKEVLCVQCTGTHKLS